MTSKNLLCLWTIGILIVLAGCGEKTPPPQQEMPLIPMQDFFRNPEKAGFKISPNGEYLSFLKPWKHRLNIYVQKIGQDQAIRITESTQRDILDYLWANDQRLIYLMDRNGDENYRAYAVNIDGSGLKDLTPFENVRVQIIDDLEDSPDEIMIGMNRRNPKIFDAYRLNINTGEMRMVGDNPGNISDWMTDNAGQLRVASATDGLHDTLLYRKTEADPFKAIVTTDFKDTLAPLYFTFDNQYLYVSSNLGRDKQAIYRYDIANGKLLDLLYDNPDVDVHTLIRSKHRKVITGVSFFTDKRHYHFFDEDRRHLQENLEKQLPGSEVVAGDGGTNLKSRDEARIIVRTYNDKSLGAYYLYHRLTGELKKLADVSPWLKGTELADMLPIHFQSRDGLTIHGYLTLPKGVKPKNLPVVINPHGGPWVRDHWGFNPEVQFLVNRGVAVLQMNFRGSTGYGKAFWQAGFKQWGRKMQDDITDGVQWLIQQGIADPKRVGIYGGSYGGYATLAGVTFTPDLYACGVDYVGPSNLFTLLASLPPYWGLELQKFYEMVGDPVKDKELLTAVSPLFHADRIKAPLFVAQGAHDPRVKKAESDQIVAALKKRGIAVLYMVKDNEGHGFSNEENRFDFYRAMEEFLGKHLGSKVEKRRELQTR
ncbi:MAG: prolyl oligopeptidase family serine peptidase [Desulfobaccales bacterium]